MVDLKDIARVGSRSKEPELSGCNLNQMFGRPSSVDVILSEVHREIDLARTEFDDVVVDLQRKSGITLDELFGSLSRDQVCVRSE